LELRDCGSGTSSSRSTRDHGSIERELPVEIRVGALHVAKRGIDTGAVVGKSLLESTDGFEDILSRVGAVEKSVGP